MPAILTVVRNEASKWLPSVLNAWADFADTIIALDDGSTDATPDVLQACPKVQYHRRNAGPMWGSEAPVRQELWQLGVTSGAEWLFVLDADMVPASNPRRLFVPQADSVAFLLYDLWSLNPPAYRHDGYWQGHTNYRTWAVRNPGAAFADAWPDRGIHTGHFPSNLKPGRTVFAPPEYSLLHMAYSDADARAAKAAQYASKAPQLSLHELEHARSILDSNVEVSKFPHRIEYTIERAASAV